MQRKSSKSSKTNSETINVPSRFECLRIVRHFVKENIPKHSFSNAEVEQITLAIDEACSNVIEHSYKMNENKRFSISLKSNGEKLEFRIEDEGVGMKKAISEKPNLKRYVKERKEGGLGKHIIRSVMDSVKYRKKGKKNILMLTKYYDR